jgi:hypothetical protein
VPSRLASFSDSKTTCQQGIRLKNLHLTKTPALRALTSGKATGSDAWRLFSRRFFADSPCNFLIIHGDEDSKPRWMWFLGRAHGTGRPKFEQTIKMSINTSRKMEGRSQAIPSWNDFAGSMDAFALHTSRAQIGTTDAIANSRIGHAGVLP